MVTFSFAAVVLVSCLACLVTAAGIYAISRHEPWGAPIPPTS